MQNYLLSKFNSINLYFYSQQRSTNYITYFNVQNQDATIASVRPTFSPFSPIQNFLTHCWGYLKHKIIFCRCESLFYRSKEEKILYNKVH